MTIEIIEAEIDTPYDIISHQVSKFSRSGGKYLIARALLRSGEKVSIKGEMNTCAVAFPYRFYGSYVESEKYGTTFEFYSYEPIISNNSEGLIDYLSRHVTFLGRKRSADIVAHFGDRAMEVIRNEPWKLVEVDGIGKATADSIRGYFESDCIVDPVAYSRLYDLLSDIKPPRQVINSLIKNFGAGAVSFIVENPYRLLDYPGLGFSRIDGLATSKLGYARGGFHRKAAAVIEAIKKSQENGSTFIQKNFLLTAAMSLINESVNAGVLESMKAMGMITFEGDKIALMSMASSERMIARELSRIAENAHPLSFEIDCTGLEGEQVHAVKLVEENGVAIISGIPGSGKSFTTAHIIKNFYENGITDIIVVAPTGKAARRDAELVASAVPGADIPCRTIHSTLGVDFSSSDTGVPEEEARINRGRKGFYFLHDEEHPLPCRLLVADEFSMCDSELAASLFRAIPDGCRLLIVGDHNQLPSVGPGAVLRDLIEAGLPTAILDKPRRNSGAVAYACHFINLGQKPRYFNEFIPEKGVNWVHHEVESEQHALEQICAIHMDGVDKSKFKNIEDYRKEIRRIKWTYQVVSPEKKGVLGCESINAMMSGLMHQGECGPCVDGVEEDDVPFRVGDKVIRTKNGKAMALVQTGDINDPIYYKYLVDTLGIDGAGIVAEEVEGGRERVFAVLGGEYYMTMSGLVNGDMGEIAAIVNRGGKDSVIVDFTGPDRKFLLPIDDAKIILAYSVTVHKCQGSGFPRVIMPLTDFFWNPKTKTGLFDRQLVYTGFSRVIDRLYTVGRISCLHAAITRKSASRRTTMLGKYLQGSLIKK